MAAVSLLNVAVRNNPAPFTSPYEFEITFECLEKLDKDLEWKLTYVGSATSDILGVTVILLTCSYDGREFVRVGYYVNNEYTDEALIAEPPAKAVVEKVRRSILAEKPRVTRFAIKWDSEASAPAEFPPEQPDADNQEDDETAYGAEELEEDEVEAEGEPEVKEGEDAEMAEANPVEQPKEEDEVSDAGSEDIEAESSASEDEDEEEEEGEGEAEGEAADEMDTDTAAPTGATEKPQPPQQQGDVMVH
ncbi:unnamed protein product [Aureobasidium uvarum]|uniref:Histone chaperone n=1 Tax=Aureobasidium uvarum TaxID=2773716 RepID=A0A9N8KCH8_9PEZI|nr:unnamed protein product [Aureobasidium uvarum]